MQAGVQAGVLQRRHPGCRILRLNVTADHAARVRGDARRVQRWISDVRNWTQFYPGTKVAVRIGNGLEPIRTGAKFETNRDMLGLKLPMSYELVEYEPGKRLVLSGLSEHHTQMDQFFFMADRHDANFCCVRYITDIRLREWRAYLQPLAARYMAKVPEEAVGNLQKILNSAWSPIYSSDFDHVFRQELRSSNGKASYSNGKGSNGSSRSGTTKVRASTSNGSKGGWLRGMFSSANRGDHSATHSPGGTEGVVLDPMGYYSLLGLAPGSQLDDEEIKAAYRRLAMQLHPDRQTGKGEAARAAAAQQFARLLKAYETLKDPEQRQLYNSGQLIEATFHL